MADARTSGYSGKPLYVKLGFKPGWQIGTVDAPAHYPELMAGAGNLSFVSDGAELDAVHVFLHGRESIADHARAAIGRLRDGGMLWVSWAKKTSKLNAGVTENDLRAAILPLGWVDVKVCAVDADWSGLKFLKRKS